MMIHHNGKYYSQLLAELVHSRAARTYLEIGVCHGANFSGIACETAIGVDPFFNLTHNIANGKKRIHLAQTGSDAFFESGELEELAPEGVDFAFLDGMHLFEFLLRDFYKTERRCRRNSLVAMHDCLPVNTEMAERAHDPAGRKDQEFASWWTGDVWKIIPILKKYRPGLTVIAAKAPPTGLLFVTNLDPSSDILERNYLKIVSEFAALESNEANIRAAYASIPVLETAALGGFDHSLHFVL